MKTNKPHEIGRVFIGLLLMAVMAGCGSVPDDARLPFVQNRGQSNFFAKPKREVFEVLEQILRDSGYTIVRSATAQGILEARGQMLESAETGQARQYLVSARVRAVDVAESSVELTVREVEERDFKAGATSEILGDHGRYDRLFAVLEERLGEGSWLPPGPQTN